MVERNLSVLNVIYIVFPALFLPVTLFLYYPISQRLGFRGVIISALLFTLVSIWCRIEIDGDYPYVSTLFGSIANAIALPLYLQEIAHSIPLWFAPEEVLLCFHSVEKKD